MQITRTHLAGAAVLLAALGTAQAQTAMRAPGLAIRPMADVTQAERINQLAAQVAQLQSRLAADETKLAQASQAANDAKVAVGFVNKGYDQQFKAMSADLSSLRASYQAHTHKFAHRQIGFTNVSTGGGYASLIQKNVDTYEATTPPQ